MSQIEELYCAWVENIRNPRELDIAYKNVLYMLSQMVGKEKAYQIDEMYMNCVNMEQMQAFKAGFQRATALWKEC